MMRTIPATTRLAAALLMALAASPAWAEVRSLSQDWRFHAGEAQGAERSAFDDQAWQRVAVPHDFSIMDRADGSAPFDADAISGQDSGYLPGGVGWYRRHLTLTPAEASRIVRLNFEAVYMDADIWVNGKHLKKHRYGYTAFAVDLTGKIRAGDNTIVVRVDHADPSSRWYAGSGLIRPVALEILDPIHIEPESVFVTTPVATEDRGEVSVRAAIANRSGRTQSAEWVARVVAASGETIAEARQTHAVAAGARVQPSLELTVVRPRLWSPDSPNLYTLVQEVRIGGATVDGAVVDERRTRFGIRTIALDAANGLRINGQPLLLRGGNIHHDNYMIGAAGAPDAEARKVALMKAAGYNAIRSAHNPASQATLDAADELGMLVINEAFDAWNKSKRDKDYSRFFSEDWQQDVDSLVISSRNHPSVLFWSIGNEIPEDGTPQGVETARKLAERVRGLDPTRPVTQGINADPPKSTNQAAMLGVVGYNYHAHIFAEEHQRLPGLAMYTSESLPQDLFSYWRAVETMPWVIGDFVWTAVDYLGEAGIGWMGYSQDWQKLGPYPWHLAYCGEIDATGRLRPAAYYRQVVWKTGATPISAFVRQPKGSEDLPDRDFYPTTPPHLDWSLDDVHPSWTWPGQEGKRQEVLVYSELPEVELFLNGKSLGRKPVSVDSEYKAAYDVPYAPGRLLAVGYRDGREAARWELRTAGAPAVAVATADRSQLTANGEDLVYVTVELHDIGGTPIYARNDDRQVRVRVSGAGTLAGIGNGNPIDISSFQSGERKTFHGRVVAVVRAGTQAGPVLIDIEVEGLPSRQLRLDAVTPQPF